MPTSVPTARLNVPAASGIVTAIATSAVSAESASSERQTPGRQERLRHPQREQDEQDGEDVERADVAERQCRADARRGGCRRCGADREISHGRGLRWSWPGPRPSMTRRSSVELQHRGRPRMTRPVAHDEHAIADRGQLGGVRRRHEHGRAARRRVVRRARRSRPWRRRRRLGSARRAAARAGRCAATSPARPSAGCRR